jgi:hypothetical protein
MSPSSCTTLFKIFVCNSFALPSHHQLPTVKISLLSSPLLCEFSLVFCSGRGFTGFFYPRKGSCEIQREHMRECVLASTYPLFAILAHALSWNCWNCFLPSSVPCLIDQRAHRRSPAQYHLKKILLRTILQRSEKRKSHTRLSLTNTHDLQKEARI